MLMHDLRITALTGADCIATMHTSNWEITLTGALSPQDVMNAMQCRWQMHRQTAKLHRSCDKLENLLSEISLPVRCKPLELALLVPVNVILPFCLVLMRHLHITACIMRLSYQTRCAESLRQ